MNGHRDRSGFTLVEMLAVILVIGVLVAVVVGVAGRAIAGAAEKQTRLNMQTIMNAVDAYYKEEQRWPDPTPREGDAGYDHKVQNNDLFKRLRACPGAKKRLAELSRSAYKNTGDNTIFVDGWENPLKYHLTGGAGGGPFLESAGRDGDFSTQVDNVRSDDR